MTVPPLPRGFVVRGLQRECSGTVASGPLQICMRSQIQYVPHVRPKTQSDKVNEVVVPPRHSAVVAVAALLLCMMVYNY